MLQDMNSICSNGFRIAKCMKEYFVYKRNYKGAVYSALLAKSLDQKLWDDSPYLLKQLPGIGMVTAKVIFIDALMLLTLIIHMHKQPVGECSYFDVLSRHCIQWELNRLRHLLKLILGE